MELYRIIVDYLRVLFVGNVGLSNIETDPQATRQQVWELQRVWVTPQIWCTATLHFTCFHFFHYFKSLNFLGHWTHGLSSIFFIPIWYIMNHYDIYSTIFKILRHSSTLFNYMSVDPSNWLSYCSFFDVSQLSLSQLSRHHQGQFANGSAMTLIQTESNSSHVQMWFCGLVGLVSRAKHIKFQGLSQFSISFPSFSHPFPRFVNEEQGFALWHPYIGSIYYSKYAANPQWDLAVA